MVSSGSLRTSSPGRELFSDVRVLAHIGVRTSWGAALRELLQSCSDGGSLEFAYLDYAKSGFCSQFASYFKDVVKLDQAGFSNRHAACKMVEIRINS